MITWLAFQAAYTVWYVRWAVVHAYLEFDWWQGIAGIAQIAACVFALWTINEMRKERRAAIRPHVEVYQVNLLSAHPVDMQYIQFLHWIRLINYGPGSAQDCQVVFEPSNGNEPVSLCPAGYSPGFNTPGRWRADEIINVHLVWKSTHRLDGLLTISYKSLVGEQRRRRGRLFSMGENEVRYTRLD